MSPLRNPRWGSPHLSIVASRVCWVADFSPDVLALLGFGASSSGVLCLEPGWAFDDGGAPLMLSFPLLLDLVVGMFERNSVDKCGGGEEMRRLLDEKSND